MFRLVPPLFVWSWLSIDFYGWPLPKIPPWLNHRYHLGVWRRHRRRSLVVGRAIAGFEPDPAAATGEEKVRRRITKFMGSLSKIRARCVSVWCTNRKLFPLATATMPCPPLLLLMLVTGGSMKTNFLLSSANELNGKLFLLVWPCSIPSCTAVPHIHSALADIVFVVVSSELHCALFWSTGDNYR